jgi:hypothetical protein
VGGGSSTAGLTKTVLEVEGVSVGGAVFLVTSPLALVLSVARNSSQSANCSNHEGATYVLP